MYNDIKYIASLIDSDTSQIISENSEWETSDVASVVVFRRYNNHIETFFKSLSRVNFILYAYSYGHKDETDWQDRIKASFDIFNDISTLSDTQAAKRINKDKIDILVDLKGHTRASRIGIFALKPAPIQISFLGFVGSTGSSCHDYFVADKTTVSPQIRKYFSEKIIYLPYSYWPTNNKLRLSRNMYTRSQFGLPQDAFVFVSFNQPYKIDQRIFTVWLRILKKIPNSVLWLWKRLGPEKKYLSAYAKKHGINPKRIIFSDRLPKSEHLKRLSLADLGLDTYSINGHTTTADTLWAGVPVITTPGKHFASRVSASMLRAVGLPELITKSLEKYEALAVSLAKKPNKLSALRSKLRTNITKTPLFNTEGYTGYLEKGFIAAYDLFSRGKKPKTIYVQP